MVALMTQRGVDVCGVERGRGVGVEDPAAAGERGELLGPAGSDRLHQGGVAVVDEIRKRRRIAVFLAHEQQGHAGGEQNERGRQLGLFQSHQGDQPVTSGAVADVVVILGEDDEALRWNGRRRSAVVAIPEHGVLALVDEPLVHGPRDVVDRAEIDVVPGALTGERGVERVMEVIVPLGVHPEALPHRPG